MKKLLCIFLAVCLVMLASCRLDNGKTVTGDVKDKQQASPVDNVNGTTQEDNAANVKEDADDGNSDEENETDNKVQASIEELALELGCVLSDGGEYKADAERLCQAFMGGDTQTIAEFTMGKSEYYDFIKDAEISSYTLYPISFTEEKTAELEKLYQYPLAQDKYLVEFDLVKSDTDFFTAGKKLFCFGLEIDAVAGNLLAYFVPYEKAGESMTFSYNTEYADYFIDELSALYFRNDRVYDGKNYPDSFDFSDSPHLITHLMARCGAYSEPPYTHAEINEFIAESFDGNKGLSLSEISANGWTSAGIVYPSDDPERIYGCSWGHGGTSVEHRVIGVEKYGNRSIYTVEFYADYAGIALAKRADFYFDELENGLLKLTLVNIYDDTGREMAIVSI